MISQIAGVFGETITVRSVAGTMGMMGTLNLVGRQLFIEGAKLLSWGTGSFWAAACLSGFGATTAGVQTYIVGCLAMEIGKNSGLELDSDRVRKTITSAKNNYSDFIHKWKTNSQQTVN